MVTDKARMAFVIVGHERADKDIHTDFYMLPVIPGRFAAFGCRSSEQ
jgi:hypothetical protein